MIKVYYIKVKYAQRYSREFTTDVISKELKINKELVNILTDKFGKPYINNFGNFHFNTSHSSNILVCGISEQQIGVDVEKIKPIKNKIVERFFTIQEKEYVYKTSSDQNKRFIEVWTKKEAYIKWVGKGIEIQLNSFDVIENSRIMTRYIGDYILSICTDTTLENEDINLIEVSEI